MVICIFTSYILIFLDISLEDIFLLYFVKLLSYCKYIFTCNAHLIISMNICRQY